MDITPKWPAFMFAASKQIDEGAVSGMLVSLSEISKIFHQEEDYAAVAKRFNLGKGDVEEWWKTVAYPTNHGKLLVADLKECIAVLASSGVVSKDESRSSLYGLLSSKSFFRKEERDTC
jgi:hypothetical protein